MTDPVVDRIVAQKYGKTMKKLERVSDGDLDDATKRFILKQEARIAELEHLLRDAEFRFTNALDNIGEAMRQLQEAQINKDPQ